MRVISETNKKMHEDYLHTLKLRQSIFEKSYPSVSGKTLREIDRIKLPMGEREELKLLLSEIYAHQVYFSSFTESGSKSDAVRRTFGSEAGFLYMLFEKCMSSDGTFLLVYKKRNGDIGIYVGRDMVGIFSKFEVVLAVDLCEHAYFFDYGFDKKRYVKAALSSLDLSKIENKVEKSKK